MCLTRQELTGLHSATAMQAHTEQATADVNLSTAVQCG